MRSLKALSAALLVGFSACNFASAVEIGDEAPGFTATTTEGEQVSLDGALKGADAVVVCFTCNGCPVARAYEDRFIEFNEAYKDKDVTFIALNCNNRTEGLDAMKKRAEEEGFNFIYAFDESGDAARAYGARVTPELFVVDSDGKVQYHGAFDDNQRKPTKAYLASAVDAVLAGKKPETAKTKAFGCGIKLK